MSKRMHGLSVTECDEQQAQADPAELKPERDLQVPEVGQAALVYCKQSGLYRKVDGRSQLADEFRARSLTALRSDTGSPAWIPV